MAWITPDDAAGTTRRLAIFDALDALPARHRAAVILRYYHDYDYATIAQILNTTSTNVGAMLSRALDRLKVALEPEQGAAGRTGR
jgi:RNA polymerase sigma factor (sigma-70 family)